MEKSDEVAKQAQGSSSKLVLLILGALFLVGASVLGTLAATGELTGSEGETSTQVDSSNESAAVPQQENQVIVKDETDKDENKEDDDPVATASWAVASKVDVPDIFVDLDSFYQDSYQGPSAASFVQAFSLGQLDDGREVVALEAPIFGIGASQGFGIIVIDGDSHTILAQDTSLPYFRAELDQEVKEYVGPDLKPNAKIDYETRIPGLSFESDFIYNGQKFEAGYILPDLLKTVDPDPDVNASVEVANIGEVAGGTLYEIRTIPAKQGDKDYYALSRFLLKLPSGLTQGYGITGELTREKIDPIVWNDGTANEADYISAGRGCSIFAGGSELSIDTDVDDLVKIGASKQGQNIYSFKDKDHPLMKLHYEEYSKGEDFVKEESRGLSYDDFIEERAIYLVEDGLGRFLVFSNQDYVPAYGCAKPVVYIYPEEELTLNVEVGADVTISEPHYEADGWQNVTARPDGQLSYRGQEYDSLFWEGYGHGEYPEIHQGFVVESSQAIATWEQHLVQLGMNPNEIEDFTEFWSSKIPDTPYVRISWLGTEDLEQLAPLKISVEYDTLIRVFMDMEGLSEEIEMPEQRLGAIERSGFTITEWGGLARDGSVPRLQ